jgi:hypothetical protein
MAVHNIDVKHLDSGLFDAADIFAQAHEISGNDGGKNLNHEKYPPGKTAPLSSAAIPNVLPGRIETLSHINMNLANARRPAELAFRSKA